MAFCTKCGTETGEGNFCPKCGAPVQAKNAVPAIPPPPPGTSGGVPGQIPPPPKAAGRKSAGAVVCGLAGVLFMVIGAIGSALPWATASGGFFTVSVGGLKGDGVITIVASLIGLGFFLIGALLKYRWPFIVALVMSLAVAAVSIYDAGSISSNVSVGIGLILCIVAGVLGSIAGIVGIAVPRRSA